MENIDKKFNDKRIIALWAFSESVLGGFLHLMRIPLTGLLIGGLAIVFLSLIAYNNSNKYEIIKATLIVLVIKFVISPYTPVIAFMSVAIQGFLCFLFCKLFRKTGVGIYVFSIVAMSFFSVQKLIMVQILFGNSLWESIDSYSQYIAKQFGFHGFGISLGLIVFYISIHLLSGLFFSAMTLIILKDIKALEPVNNEKQFNDYEYKLLNSKTKNRRRKLIKRLTIFAILLIFIGFSYFIDAQKGFYGYLITVIRFISIIIVWLFFIAPLITKTLAKYLAKKHEKYHGEVSEIINAFPHIKEVGIDAWKSVKESKGVFKYPLFIRKVIINFLVY